MKTPPLFRFLLSAVRRPHGQGQTTIQPSRDVGCVPRTEGDTRPRTPAKVRFVETVAPTLESPAETPETTPCTALLDDALLANLGKLVEALPAMAAELDQLGNAVRRMRTAEAACAATTGNRSSNPLLEEQETARLRLKGQVQRVQMALQGRKHDFSYQPDIRQVSHLGQRRALWVHLNRALQSLDRGLDIGLDRDLTQAPGPTQPPTDTINALVLQLAPPDLPHSQALEQLRSDLHEPLQRRQAVLNDLKALKGSDPIRRTRLQADHHNAQKDLFELLRLYSFDERQHLDGHPRQETLRHTTDSIHTRYMKLRDDLVARPDDLKAAGLVLVVDEFQRVA